MEKIFSPLFIGYPISPLAYTWAFLFPDCRVAFDIPPISLNRPDVSYQAINMDTLDLCYPENYTG
jgi:hypothetical protein